MAYTMPQKQGIAYLGVAVAIAIIFGGAFYFLSANRVAAPETPAPVTAPASAKEIIFTGSHESGFEGYVSRVLYALKYDPGIFSVSSSSLADRAISIREKGSGKIHTVGFFYNGGAGFANPRELWENHPYCADCAETTNTVSIARASDMLTFASAKEEWLIFSSTYASPPAARINNEEDPSEAQRAKEGRLLFGFAVIKLEKPAGIAEKVIETLWLHSEEASAPEKTSLKLYFTNEAVCPDATCENVVSVTRLVPKTAKVATVAIEELLKGPTKEELADGYVMNIPAGSKLNSLTIQNGEARADFNAQTQSGGGSASMRYRTEQIRETLLQFPTVKSVRLSVDGETEGIFQP